MSEPYTDTTSGPYATAAPTYWAAGWRGILPLPAGAKTPVPRGYTGATGAWPSYPDVQAWTEDQPGGNIALRLPPDVLGVDVDHYGNKPGGAVLAHLEAQLGVLPPTWRTTSRDDGVSGIRLYRIPAGLRWPGVLGPGIETIRHEHRYAVAWPSVHPGGGTYRWITPDGATTLGVVPTIDDLPDLPAAWIEHFTHGELATDQARADLSGSAAHQWITARDSGALPPCRHMERALQRGLADMTGATSRHDTMLQLTNRLVWLAGEGHVGSPDALAQAQRAFLAAVAGDRDPSEAAAEFDRMVTGAVRIAAAAHPEPSTDPCQSPLAGLLPPRQEQPWTPPSNASPQPSNESLTSSPTPPSATASTSSPDTTSPSATTSYDASTTETQPPPATWARTDLTTYLDGTHEPIEPTLFPREDGVCLVYPGLTHSFHGESESGKSMVLQYECARLIQDGHDVLYVDFESDAAAVTGRLLLFGATRRQVLDHFDYRRPEVSPNTSATELEAWSGLLAGRYTLAVIDGVTDSLGVFGLSTKDNDEIARWMRVLPRQVADRTGAAVAVIDHVTKDSENRGRFAIGGQAKLAGLTGAAYTVEIAEPLGIGLKGAIVLRVGKDRPGYVRGHSAPMRADRTQEVARIVVDSTGAQLSVTVQARSGAETPREARPAMRFTGLMEKISKALEAADSPLSTRALRELVGGNKDRLGVAIRDLLLDGYIAVEEGARGATMHRLVRDYRQRLDPKSDLFDPLDPTVMASSNPDRGHRGPTVADRGPATVKSDRGSGPLPVGGPATVNAPSGRSTVAHGKQTPIAGGKYVYDHDSGLTLDAHTQEIVDDTLAGA
jgi:hypothetical protein